MAHHHDERGTDRFDGKPITLCERLGVDSLSARIRGVDNYVISFQHPAYFGDHRTADVLTCLTCGALVMDDETARHNAWHTQLEAALTLPTGRS